MNGFVVGAVIVGLVLAYVGLTWLASGHELVPGVTFKQAEKVNPKAEGEQPDLGL